jgi:linoleoyl-CoA desaturase
VSIHSQIIFNFPFNMSKKVSFRPVDKSKAKFFPTVRKRVNAYFKENGISKTANRSMVIKTVIMFMVYLTPYFLMMFGVITEPWLMLLMAGLMGVGAAGVGLSVQHDANHGAYSKNPKINRILSWSINLIGANAYTWKVQHNYLHHTYTNVHDLDEDIAGRGILRFSPFAELKPFHRFQYIYAFFLYGLGTLQWVLVKDFKQFRDYTKRGMHKVVRANLKEEIAILVVSKVFYYTAIIVLPLMLLEISFWQWLAGFVFMQWVTGMILALIFQVAHLMEETSHHPFPHETGTIENQWAIHQVETTANFATNSVFLNWFAGGLNFQVEHHLFPDVCHVHYKPISKIVKETAQEFGIPYYEKKTLFSALVSHIRLLKKLGNGEPVIMNHHHGHGPTPKAKQQAAAPVS